MIASQLVVLTSLLPAAARPAGPVPLKAQFSVPSMSSMRAPNTRRTLLAGSSTNE
jgi:hypothetical protein